MKRILKSLLLLAVVVGVAAGSTGAYFTSTVTAADNEIQVGTLRLAVDSTKVHTSLGTGAVWGHPGAYNVVYDRDGVSFESNLGLEDWRNAAPGPYTAYSNDAGADVLPEGNFSYWVALRNIGSIPMKVSADLNDTGTWTVDPAVDAADPTGYCTSGWLNNYDVVRARAIEVYARDNCQGHEECENIYYALRNHSGGWTYADAYENGTPTTSARTHTGDPLGRVYISWNGDSISNPVQLDPNEFVVARVDLNFDNSAAIPQVQNCYQGATYRYDLNGYAYQLGDSSW